ncbi:uncharacterized protein EV154DRAFT_481544 [Mucor mucedo]|uniref:uncharacterized protein n=1 Tax=Mucor mucedo TaxID=29922 RepID=UPI002220B62D|nr:uncharacterized protein EV154DRAFT_481544 [Mucor mucedo]KAI7891144.1 hypothetical protein EV154DRAFT_481544 [Mucor mucedo]
MTTVPEDKNYKDITSQVQYIRSRIQICRCVFQVYIQIFERNIERSEHSGGLCGKNPQHVVKTRNIWCSFTTRCGKTPKLYHQMLRVFATYCGFLPPIVAGFFRMLRNYTTRGTY